jgi:hypothetical protein
LSSLVKRDNEFDKEDNKPDADDDEINEVSEVRDSEDDEDNEEDEDDIGNNNDDDEDEDGDDDDNDDTSGPVSLGSRLSGFDTSVRSRLDDEEEEDDDDGEASERPLISTLVGVGFVTFNFFFFLILSVVPTSLRQLRQ